MAESVDQAVKSDGLAAFEALMRRHERLVLVSALRLLGNTADGQDVSQEVFLRLYRNLNKLEGERVIAAWLYWVTVNACSFQKLTLNTDVDIKAGQKVVIGRHGINREQALFLVVSAQVVN
jgi:Sigma-70 region 2